MDINQAVKLVTRYIYDTKGEKVDINALKIMMNHDQQNKLKSAVKVAVDYYNSKEIKT